MNRLTWWPMGTKDMMKIPPQRVAKVTSSAGY